MGLEPLTQATWDDLNQALLYLALLWASVVTFAGFMLFGRAIIPSLVYTGHVPQRSERLRLPIFAVAAIAGIAVIVFASLWIGSLGFLYDIYDRKWY